MASKSSANAKLLRVLKQGDADFEDAWRGICRRDSAPSWTAEVSEVQPIIDRVREKGQSGLLSCVKEIDGIAVRRLEVGREEWDAGCDRVDPADRAAIGKAAMRIRDFHRKRIPSSWEMREEGGGYMGQRVRPLARVGIVVPDDVRLNPVSIIMNASPPSVVEVPEIVLAAAPEADGAIRPEILMAARVAGVHRVFKMGAPHSVAALAFGTDVVPRVERIVGPSSPKADVAKRLVAGVVGVDATGGPTEVCVVADKGAPPAWLAADILAQAERSAATQVLLITHYKGLVSRVQEQLTKQLKALPRTRVPKQALIARGAAIVTKRLDDSLALANAYAPQNLVLALDNAEAASKSIVNAGSIYLGHYTPVAVGDYLAGPNHVLPTGGTARFASPLSVDDFLKRTSFIKFEPPKLRDLGAEVIRLAGVEGLSAHGTSVDLRLQKIRRARREREAAREAEL